METGVYLHSKDIDHLIAAYVVDENTVHLLNAYYILFSKNKYFHFCKGLLLGYIRVVYHKRALPNPRLFETPNENNEIFIQSTNGKNRKKRHNAFLLFGYKVVLENVEPYIKTIHRNRFLYSDNTKMTGEIPRCVIKRKKFDYWEHWKATGNLAGCGCPTFKCIKFMTGTKLCGITARRADMRATKLFEIKYPKN